MGAERLMQCMEVWGGNRAVNNGVVMPGLDAWVFSQPYDGEEAGGDVHYVSSCATGRITRVLVADVTGHGAKVASTADQLRSFMRKYVNYLDQSRFVERMNEAFTDADSDGRFATAVVGTYWAPTTQLTISNAGHPRPIVYEAKRRAWRVLRPSDTPDAVGPLNLPLGVDRPTTYDVMSVKLARNDLVLLYSDSLIEARDEAGSLLGEKGLVEHLNELDASSPSTLISDLLERLREYDIGDEWDDDVTALLIRRNEMALRMGVGDYLIAGWRFTGRFFESILGRGPAGFPQWGKKTIGGVFYRPWNGRSDDKASV